MADPTPCPRCGTPGTGNFCSTCGASRGQRACAACGHTPEAGARFCTRCGSPLAAGAAPGAGAPAAGAAPAADRSPTLGWWIAGLAMVALILLVAYPVLTAPEEGVRPEGAAPAPTAGAAGVDLSSMTPREAADRLYNRIMEAAARQDSTEIRMFMPMAIAAYERARPLDADGHYHLSLLQRTAGDYAAAILTAQDALDQWPNHLLALAAAAEAAEAQGNPDHARAYWERFLAAYEEEMAAGRQEYADHGRVMGQLLERARAAAG